MTKTSHGGRVVNHARQNIPSFQYKSSYDRWEKKYKHMKSGIRIKHVRFLTITIGMTAEKTSSSPNQVPRSR